jgi:hypothetical protein
MESEIFLSFSQDPATGFYSEPDEASPLHPDTIPLCSWSHISFLQTDMHL